MTMTSVVKPLVFVSRRLPSRAIEVLQPSCHLTVWDHDEPPSRHDFLHKVKDVDGLLCLLTDKVDRELLDAAGPQLQVVSTMSVGFDHIDVTECKARNIKVGYTPDVLTSATAELTVALLLAASRRLKEAMTAVVSGGWGTWKPSWLCGQGLDGATVGIVGFGRIGVSVAERLQPFGVNKFLYSGRSEKTDTGSVTAEFTSFAKLLELSDFVIACCSLNKDTAGMFDKRAFQQMKKSAVFVNTSRGGVVQQEDLYHALKRGEIAAAGVDVTVPEPLPPDSPLLSLDNLVVLPHVGSATHAAREGMAELAARNLLAGLCGHVMPAALC